MNMIDKTIEKPGMVAYLGLNGPDKRDNKCLWEPYKDTQAFHVAIKRFEKLYNHLFLNGSSIKLIGDKKPRFDENSFLTIAINAHGDSEGYRHRVELEEGLSYTDRFYKSDLVTSLLDAGGAFLFLLHSCYSGICKGDFPVKGTLITSEDRNEICCDFMGSSLIEDVVNASLISGYILEQGISTRSIKEYIGPRQNIRKAVDKTTSFIGFTGRELKVLAPKKPAEMRFDFFFDNYFWSGEQDRERIPLLLELPGTTKERIMGLLQSCGRNLIINKLDMINILFDNVINEGLNWKEGTRTPLMVNNVNKLLDKLEDTNCLNWNQIGSYRFRGI